MLAVAAHLWVIGAWIERAEPPAWGARTAPALAVRQIPAADGVPPPMPLPMPPPMLQLKPRTLPAPPKTPLATADRLPVATDAEPAVAHAESAGTEAWSGPAPPPAAPPSELAAPPTYRTLPPPAATLHYAVRRGEVTGEARLIWRPAADGRYELELRAVAESVAPRRGAATVALAPHWTSRGAFDGAGIAPERFAVSRRGRERHAANFQREAGIVTFAGPARTWPLLAGAQDRLSWMVQLAAVLQAEPELARAGAQISMMVAGAHGDADVWTFDVQESAPAVGPGGEPVATLRLHRPARHAHDAQVEVWVASALHYLPVRLRLGRAAGGESTEFTLRALQAP